MRAPERRSCPGGAPAATPSIGSDRRASSRSAAEPPARQPGPIAVIAVGLPIEDVIAKLTAIQADHPGAHIRQGKWNGWEIWPPGTHPAGAKTRPPGRTQRLPYKRNSQPATHRDGQRIAEALGQRSRDDFQQEGVGATQLRDTYSSPRRFAARSLWCLHSSLTLTKLNSTTSKISGVPAHRPPSSARQRATTLATRSPTISSGYGRVFVGDHVRGIGLMRAGHRMGSCRPVLRRARRTGYGPGR